MGKWLKHFQEGSETFLLDERKHDWPVKGDALYQFISIEEREQIERLLQDGQVDDALEILRKAYRWVQSHPGYFSEPTTVLQNITRVADWVKKRVFLRVIPDNVAR